MKNKIFALFTAVVICVAVILPVSAVADESLTPGFAAVERTLPLVVDYADVLTDEEEILLEAKLEELGSENKLEIGVVTVDSFEGKDPQAFADDFYDYNGYGYGEADDGLIIVFNTGRTDQNRNITLSTCGKAINLVTDDEMNRMFDEMITLLMLQDYAGAFNVFTYECEKAIDTSVPLYYIPMSVVIAFVLAFIIVKIQASSLKTVRQKVDASDYVGNVVLTGESDRFMYKNVRKIPKPKSNSSSVHGSSSGRSHGGGSRSF